MANVADARFQNSERRIRDALALLLNTKRLADISVSELASKAEVSRATFYVHYDNVGDVFDELVQEVMVDVRSFSERFSCEGPPCRGADKPLYCERVRAEERYAGVIREARFFPEMMSLAWADRDCISDAVAKGVDQTIMRAIRLFQMSGCHAVATSDFAKGDDWDRIRRAIDAFIDGGMQAMNNREKKPTR